MLRAQECRVLPPPVGGSPFMGSMCGGLVRLANPEVASAAMDHLNAGPLLPGTTQPLLVRPPAAATMPSSLHLPVLKLWKLISPCHHRYGDLCVVTTN